MCYFTPQMSTTFMDGPVMESQEEHLLGLPHDFGSPSISRYMNRVLGQKSSTGSGPWDWGQMAAPHSVAAMVVGSCPCWTGSKAGDSAGQNHCQKAVTESFGIG